MKGTGLETEYVALVCIQHAGLQQYHTLPAIAQPSLIVNTQDMHSSRALIPAVNVSDRDGL